MNIALVFVVGFVRTWAGTYTLGLPGDVRAGRMDEIASDLWEQRRQAELRRRSPGTTAGGVILRCLLGIPDDLAWRIEIAAGLKSHRRSSVNNSRFMRIGLLVAMGLPLLMVANGIAIVFGAGEWDSRSEQIIWGLVFAVCPLVAVTGVWLSATQPKAGLTLVVLGVLTASLSMFWMALLIAPVGVAIIAFTMRRGGIRPWAARAETPAAA